MGMVNLTRRPDGTLTIKEGGKGPEAPASNKKSFMSKLFHSKDDRVARSALPPDEILKRAVEKRVTGPNLDVIAELDKIDAMMNKKVT